MKDKSFIIKICNRQQDKKRKKKTPTLRKDSKGKKKKSPVREIPLCAGIQSFIKNES